MKLEVIRTDFTDKSTIGKMSIDGVFAYYTLELPWNNGANIHQTDCILPGTYEVIIDYSPHFGQDMPHILNVPDRDEIRIHVANYPKDIEGCIGIGLSKAVDFIGNSKQAFNDFFPEITGILKNRQGLYNNIKQRRNLKKYGWNRRFRF